MDRNRNAPNKLTNAHNVALRKESVDRNMVCTSVCFVCVVVALRKESVDRNSIALASMRVSTVALRKESVDRNLSNK